MKASFKDITGKKFGRLTVLQLVSKAGEEPIRWKCQCECGCFTVSQGSALRGGRAKSCGCLQRDKATKHGMAGTPTYGSWQKMKARCLNSWDPAYADYGGRGIRVCDRWLESFDHFLADMGVKPARMSLDRKDNQGNYEPGNCRWATFKTQNNNRRSNRMLTISGETMNLQSWAEKAGLPMNALWLRISHGWDPKEAVSVPLISGRPSKPRGTGRKRIHSSE